VQIKEIANLDEVTERGVALKGSICVRQENHRMTKLLEFLD
jgi:hypothetical protein